MFLQLGLGTSQILASQPFVFTQLIFLLIIPGPYLNRALGKTEPYGI